MDVVHVNVITLDPWITFVTLSLVSASAGVTRMEDSVTNANQDSGTIQTVNDVTVTDTQILVTPRLEPVLGVVTTLQDRIVKFVSEDSMEIHSLDMTSLADHVHVQVSLDPVSHMQTLVTWIQELETLSVAVFLDTLEKDVIGVTTTTTEIRPFLVEVVRNVNVTETLTLLLKETVTLEAESVSDVCMKRKDSTVNDVDQDGSATPRNNSVLDVFAMILELIGKGMVFVMQPQDSVPVTPTWLERNVMNVHPITGTLPRAKDANPVTVTRKEVTPSSVTCSKVFATANLDSVEDDVMSVKPITGATLVSSVSVSNQQPQVPISSNFNSSNYLLFSLIIFSSLIVILYPF